MRNNFSVNDLWHFSLCQFDQSLTGLPQFFGHTGVSCERTQGGGLAVDKVAPAVLGSFVRHGAVDDGLSSYLTRHGKHPHDHLHEHPEQEREVARPAALDKTLSHRRRKQKVLELNS